MLTLTAQEDIDRAQREFRARLNLDERKRPEVKNRAALVYLTDPLRVPFQGRLYELPPVGFRDGDRIMALREVLGDPDAEPKARREANEAAIRLIRRLVTPDRGLYRIRWKLRLVRNPFRRATDVEIGEMLGFLAACRMRSSITDRSGAALFAM